MSRAIHFTLPTLVAGGGTALAILGTATLLACLASIVGWTWVRFIIFLTSPWVLLAPSLFVTWTIFAINLILESLRRRFQSVRKPV